MATIDFEFTKELARGGRAQGKFQYDLKGGTITRRNLAEAEAAFLRWFKSFHFDDGIVDWKASIEGRGVFAKYSSALPYGFGPSENPN